MTKVSDLFELIQGNGFELINMDIDDNSNINFVSRTSNNNGVVAKVSKYEEKEPFPAGLLTVALGGSVLSSFVQTKPFYTGFHTMVLKPKKEMSLEEKLYYAICININDYRYSYGRQANKTLKDIEIPNETPSWLHKNKVDFSILETINKSSKNINDNSTWREFKLSNLFKMEKCKCSNSLELEDGVGIYYIGAKKNDNGVIKEVSLASDFNSNLISKGNCVVFIGQGEGSSGYTLYQNKDFIGMTGLTCGYNKNLNKYNALFLVTLLDLNYEKYSFGRSWSGSRLLNTTVKLPEKNGEPDWVYMENYIKSLPYADKI